MRSLWQWLKCKLYPTLCFPRSTSGNRYVRDTDIEAVRAFGEIRAWSEVDVEVTEE